MPTHVNPANRDRLRPRPLRERHIDSCIERLYRDGPDIEIEDFRSWALKLLTPHIDFDAALWLYGDYARVRIHSATLQGLPEDYLARLVETQPVNPVSDLQYTNPGRAICVSTLYGAEAFRESALYRQLYRPYGIEEVLTIAAQNETSGLSSLVSLFRTRGHRPRPFSRQTIRDLERLFPQLIGAASNAYFRSFASKRSVRHTRSYLSTCDQYGCLHEAEQGFLELMAQAHPGWTGPRLPFDPASDSASNQQTGYRVRVSALADLYLIEAWLPTAYDELTAREQLVADLFSTGASQKEISRKLQISLATVATYVQRAYGKLQVNSRDALNRLLQNEF